MRKLIFLLALSAFGQYPLTVTPWQAIYSNGGVAVPCVNCYVYTYNAGTTTPKATYTSYTLGTPLPNPIRTNSLGYAISGSNAITGVWVDGNACYHLVYKNSAAVTVWDQDHVCNPAQAATTVNTALLAYEALIASASGATHVGYLSPVSNAVSTTVAKKLNSWAEAVSDFGADNTGAAGSTTAINAMLTALTTGVCGHLRSGAYKITSLIVKGETCLVGDGKFNTQLLETTTSGVTPITVNGRYNRLSAFGIVPPNGSGTSTAILETPLTNTANTCGFNTYDEIEIPPSPNGAAWFKYGLQIASKANSDCNGDVITRSEFVQNVANGGAGIYLNATAGTLGSATVNAFSITDSHFSGGNGTGILCDGCSEGSVTNPFFEGLTTGMVFQSTTNTPRLSSVRGIRGEATQYWASFDATAAQNAIEIPYPFCCGITASVNDNSGGHNTIVVWGGTHTEAMGTDGVSPQFCIGLCNPGGGGAVQQSGIQFELRPVWTGAATIKYPNIFGIPSSNANTNSGLLSFLPGASGTGFTIGTLIGFGSVTQPVITANNRDTTVSTNSPSAYYGHQYGGRNLGSAGMANINTSATFGSYYSIKPIVPDGSNVNEVEAKRIYGDGSEELTVIKTLASTLPACNSGNLGKVFRVNDSNSDTPGATPASGGAYDVQVRCQYNNPAGPTYRYSIQ